MFSSLDLPASRIGPCALFCARKWFHPLFSDKSARRRLRIASWAMLVQYCCWCMETPLGIHICRCLLGNGTSLERERNFHRHASSSRDDIIGRLGRRRHVFNHGILLSSSTQFSIMLGGLFGRICRCSKSSPLESQQISSTRISRCSRPSRKVTSHRAQMLPKSRERRSQQQIDGHGDSTRQYKMHLDDIVR